MLASGWRRKLAQALRDYERSGLGSFRKKKERARLRNIFVIQLNRGETNECK